MTAEPETIYQAPASGGRGSGWIAVDDQDVYFCSHGDGALVKIPKNGDTAQVLPYGTLASCVAVDGDYLYWDEVNEISRVAKSGGERVVIADRDHVGLHMAVGSSNVYWLTDSPIYGPADFLEKADKTSLAVTTIANGKWYRQVAVGPEFGYFTAATSGGNAPGPISGALERFALAGGSPHVIFEMNNPQAVAADEAAVYFSASPDLTEVYPSTIWRVWHGEDAAKAVVHHDSYIRAIALDENCIYFVDTGALFRAPKSGGKPTFLAGTATYVNVVAVDSSGVYWSETDPDRVRRIPK